MFNIYQNSYATLSAEKYKARAMANVIYTCRHFGLLNQ